MLLGSSVTAAPDRLGEKPKHHHNSREFKVSKLKVTSPSRFLPPYFMNHTIRDTS